MYFFFFIIFFLERAVFLLTHTSCKRCRHCHQRGLGGSSDVEASLLGPDPVYPPLTSPFFDLLTAADGKDMSLELWAGQVREGGVTLSDNSPGTWRWQAAEDLLLHMIVHLLWQSKSVALASDLTISRLNCNRYLIQDVTFQSKHGRLTLKGSSLPLKRSPLCYLGFPLWRILLCGPFMGQGASYAQVLVLCWWMSSLWACGNKLNPSIYLHMARPIHLL